MLLQTAAQSKTTMGRIGYVVKRYPRFSETFIVNEILAHEANGLEIDIFALRPGVDTHFQNSISQVRAPVTYLPGSSVKSTVFWNACHQIGTRFPRLWTAIAEAKHATAVDAFQAMQLAEQIHQRNIQHLHAHFATSAATVAQIAARITGISFSVTMHAKDIFHETVIAEDLARKISDAKFVVTVSDFNRRFLTENYGFAHKIHRIYNGLDLHLFDYNPHPVPSRKIITVGRLVDKKGFRYLVAACKILADRGVEFQCQIIGTGELESVLRNQITDLSLNDRVSLIGPQPQNVVREMICSADIFAAPCVIGPDGNRDGLPTVITESLALGTPCIATDVTGIPEIVRHGKTGIIVEQENATDLANELQRLLDDPAHGRSLAQNARRLIEDEFDIHKNVALIRDLFPISRERSTPHNTAQYQGA